MRSPLSYSTRCSLIRTIDLPSVSNRWQNELGIIWTPPLGITQIHYWCDDTTGLHFYSPGQVAGDSSLYSQLQNFPWYYMEDKWEFTAALKLLKPLPTGSRVLEIGAGKGAFLAKAHDASLDICGIELNPEGANIARRKGLNVIEKDLNELCSEDSTSFDAICAFQVLEHLAQPRKFLDEALQLLKPGGLLILSVPNADVIIKLDPNRTSLLDQPPHHMSHWNEAVFRSLEGFLPLKLRCLAFEPLAPYHIDWFVNSFTQHFREQSGHLGGRIFLNRITRPLFQIALLLGLRQFVRGHTLLACFQKSVARMA